VDNQARHFGKKEHKLKVAMGDHAAGLRTERFAQDDFADSGGHNTNRYAAVGGHDIGLG